MLVHLTAQVVVLGVEALFGCSCHSLPWKKRCGCPESESCNWEKRPHNKEARLLFWNCRSFTCIWLKSNQIIKNNYQSFCSLCSYFTSYTSNAAWIHRYTPSSLIITTFQCSLSTFKVKTLSSNHPEFSKWYPCSICLCGLRGNLILKCSYPNQVCDDTFDTSFSHCPVSPHTEIINDFAQHWCHQSSKPTSQTSLY